jgi:hypothetical protein
MSCSECRNPTTLERPPAPPPTVSLSTTFRRSGYAGDGCECKATASPASRLARQNTDVSMRKVHPMVSCQRTEGDRYRPRTQHHHSLLSKIQWRYIHTFRFNAVLCESGPAHNACNRRGFGRCPGRTTALAAGGSTHIRFGNGCELRALHYNKPMRLSLSVLGLS